MDGVNKLIKFILDEFPKLTTEYTLEYKRCKMPDATMVNRIYIHKADDLANKVCPCLALDDYASFDEQDVLEDLKELINELPEKFEEAGEMYDGLDLDDDSSLLELIPSTQDLLDKCYCRIVKTDTHKEFLDGIAKKDFLDLTYYFVIEHDTDEYSMSYVIKENMLDLLKVNIDELFDIAYNNSINRSKLIKKNLSEHVKEIKSKIGKDISTPEPAELHVDTLIVTNEDNDYASFLIFDKDIMNEICDILDTDELLIIPSSVHDFLIDDMYQIDDVEYSNAVVRHVNKSMPSHYVLSDHCYSFNKLHQEFNIV